MQAARPAHPTVELAVPTADEIRVWYVRHARLGLIVCVLRTVPLPDGDVRVFDATHIETITRNRKGEPTRFSTAAFGSFYPSGVSCRSPKNGPRLLIPSSLAMGAALEGLVLRGKEPIGWSRRERYSVRFVETARQQTIELFGRPPYDFVEVKHRAAVSLSDT